MFFVFLLIYFLRKVSKKVEEIFFQNEVWKKYEEEHEVIAGYIKDGAIVFAETFAGILFISILSLVIYLVEAVI